MSKEEKKKSEIYGLNRAYLSWKQKDYEKAGEEIPTKLLHDDVHSEGELMSEEEIVEWIADTERTFLIVREQNKDIFNRLYQGFLLDLEYLVKIGKIDENTVDDLLKMENFES
jgi:hypothetical protein